MKIEKRWMKNVALIKSYLPRLPFGSLCTCNTFLIDEVSLPHHSLGRGPYVAAG
jgi:hypothetical protein